MSWNPVHFIEDYYNSLDVSSPISAQVLSCTPGEETANDKDSTNLVKEPVCKPKTLYVEKLFATKDEVFLTEKFPVTSCPAKREKTEKEISDMLRIDGTRRVI